MKQAFWSLATVTFLLLSGGCAFPTRTIAPPCTRDAAQEVPKWLQGEWIAIDQSKEPWSEEAEPVTLKVTVDPSDAEWGDVELKSGDQSWPPLVFMLFSAGDRRFLLAGVNVSEMLKKHDYDDSTLFLLQPALLTLELAGTPEKPEIHMITFLKETNNDVPVFFNDKTQVAEGLLVLNSSEEIYAMLKKGEYTSFRKYRLIRAHTE